MKEGVEPAYVIFPGPALETPAYRVCETCPPTRDDFQSYVLAGRNFSDRLWFRATGVSMFIKRQEAAKLAKGGALGTCIAELDLNDDRIYFTVTNERTGHIDVWGRTRLLLSRVIDCADTKKV